MRYSEDIIKQITEELQKVPNIRYVCNKVGIGYSTFYRWMCDHHEFHKAVEGALLLGRETTNDAAQGVIISKIQAGDFQAAKYWLGHNHEQYISPDRVPYHQYLERHRLEFLKRKTDEGDRFEALYKQYLEIEESLDPYEPEVAKEKMTYILDFVYRDDKELKELFLATYPKWKQGIIIKKTLSERNLE